MRARRISPLDILTPGQRRYFETGEYDETGGFAFLFWVWEDDGAAPTWEHAREVILDDWLARYPGTRPWFWWHADAPREPLTCRFGRVEVEHAHRRRIGGTGTPNFEALNVAPAFSFGIPNDWVSSFSEGYYNGRGRDVHGNRIGTEYREGDFAGLAPRADDPPTFESQAAYLDRHGLLTDAERRRLSADAFAPEPIDYAEDEQPDARAVHPDVWDHPCFDERLN